ncbi:shikimate dehydrogenase [Calothrix sp. PCC 6303]|uniref:shikimate dehydrogenase n=1 Tax=Calothrix sp. PCC 6303 TaxID=1170562 RepID=UPI0002E51A84|nr:shikimate dehydrogenase [Calothrix sp. PCC 6303]
MITGTTKLLGVIGDPVGHSLSPLMHNAAINTLGLDYVYLPFPIKPHNLRDAIACFAAIGVLGFSVTIPHKQAIIPFLSEVSDLAKVVGAVNTVFYQDHHWVGTNTDVTGFISPLKTTYNRDWSQTSVVILGNGGAARAIVVGCTELGCGEIHVVGRDVEKIALFRDSWQNSTLVGNLQVHHWDMLPKLLPQANLLVNTTPVGMHPQIERSPLTIEEFKQFAVASSINPPIAYDLTYNPSPTKFLQQAASVGATTINGLEMLVQQGAAALKIWLQRDTVPVDVMRQTLLQHLFN